MWYGRGSAKDIISKTKHSTAIADIRFSEAGKEFGKVEEEIFSSSLMILT